MPQETNFNVSPYFDDFDPQNEYYRVLFKPGYPIQARELTTIQSILQNQIESIGKGSFKEGQVVVPGQLSYENEVFAVEINDNFNGLPISLYLSDLIGKEIQGQESGVIADIVAVLSAEDSERNNNTLYVRYTGSGGQNFSNKTFQDGETILTNDTVVYGGKFSIQEGQGICSSIFTNSTSKGSLVNVEAGIYFCRGFFTTVSKQTLLLDQYGTEPSYRVGFDVKESIVTADDDESLYDNARSFSNYTAPGADRFKLNLVLSKKSLTSSDTDNFIELLTIENGVEKFVEFNNTQKEKLAVRNQLAKRSFDQTGDYVKKEFTIDAKDSLNDGINETGIYFSSQQTITGDSPSEDKIIYQIGPGKAFVGGYEVETEASTLIQCSKPRDLGTVSNEVIPYEAGTLFLVDNTFGSPSIGFSGSTVQLRNKRLGASQASQGDVIGISRVYDYIPVSDYEDVASKFFLRLFDINLFTNIEFSSEIPLKSPTFIEGKKSSSSGFVLAHPNTANIESIDFPSISITNVVFSPDVTGIATITTSSAHGFVSGDTVFVDGTNLSPLDYSTSDKFWSVTIPDLEVESFVFDSGGAAVGVITVTTKEPHLLSNGTSVGFNNTGRNFLNEIGPSGGQSISNAVGNVFEITIDPLDITDFSQLNNVGIVTDPLSGDSFTYLTTSEFQILAVSDEFDSLSNSSSGTVVDTSNIAVVQLNVSETVPISNDESVYIQDTSNGQFNNKFTAENVNIGARTFELKGITALNYYNGPESSVGGNATAGISLVTLYEVSGEFLNGERIVVNGVESNVVIKKITDYSTKDVKSINTGTTEAATTDFRSDVVLDSRTDLAPAGTTFRIQPSGDVTAGLKNNFTGTVSVGDIIRYESPAFGEVIYNEVSSVSVGGTDFRVVSVEDVEDVCDGSLPGSEIEVNNIVIISPTVEEDENGFLTQLGQDFIESITLEDNDIVQRREYVNQSFSQGTLVITIDPLENDIRFSTFDEDRYVITYSDGSKEPLRFDKFALSNNGKTATFYDLSQASGTADVIATIINNKPNSKTKTLNRSSVIEINYSNTKSSGIGATTLNDGLSYSGVYGIRVQDKEICLNVPDVLNVIAVYESFDQNAAKLPVVEANNFTGPSNNNQDLLVGETITGTKTRASGIIVSKPGTDKVEYVYQNSIQFSLGEIVESKDSKVKFQITGFQKESKNITQNFTLDDGQTESFYDYSRLVRSNNVEPPKRRLKIVYQNFTIGSDDTGEFITVNSYSQVDYKNDIQTYQDVSRLSDFIDIRPRVANYTPSVNGSLSPFEFNSRVFDSPGQYSRYVLAPQEDISISYQHYLPRVDKIILNPDGTFECIEGVSSENPIAPDDKTNSLTLATIELPPYLLNISDLSIEIEENKGYTMRDIQSLEDRIERLEKITELNYLEQGLENLKIKDAITGLERFKCGYFADDFADEDFHDIDDPLYRVSIDTIEKVLRPSHYTTNLDLELGSEVISGLTDSFDPNADKSFVTDLGSPGVRKTGDLVTLDYEEGVYVEQLKASKAESVTPFLVKYWQGIVTLRPDELRWPAETRQINRNETIRVDLPPRPDINITVVNNVVRNRTVRRRRVITRRGRSPFRWVTVLSPIFRRVRRRVVTRRWISTRVIRGRRIVRGKSWWRASRIFGRRRVRFVFVRRRVGWRRRRVRRRIRTLVRTNIRRRTVSITRNTARSTFISSPGRTSISVDTSSTVRNFRETVEFVRPVNISFNAERLKPLTRIYPYFEGIKIDRYVTPKLLEIEMVSGTGSFQAGEIVRSSAATTDGNLVVRLCSPGHYGGPSTAPSRTFSLIPFTQTEPPSSYTETSTFLNIDTTALGASQEDEFFGSAVEGMRLIGQTSGAECIVRPIRLITDRSGRLSGSFYVPDPNVTSNPRWRNGENTLLLTDVTSLPEEGARNESECAGEKLFRSAETVPVTETTTVTTRTITVTPPQRTNITRITNVRNNLTTITNTRTRFRRRRRRRNRDPLAQTFFVEEASGIFVTGVDIYFRNKPENLPVTVQIRTVTNGYPTNVTLPFAEATLTPDEVNLSTDGSVPTRFTFPSPVYLAGLPERNIREAPIGSTQLAEYSIVVLSDDPIYEAFISELGQRDLLDGNIIASQSTLGSLFKSQNGTTWTPSQLEDLKYRLYRADFVSEGIVRFFNPNLSISNEQVTVLGENQLETLSRKAILNVNGLASLKDDFKPGVTIVQTRTNGEQITANLIGVGGEVTVGSGLSISNVGVGYTNGLFEDVNLITKTGDGSGLIADITVSGGVISSINVTDGGISYLPGDILEIPDIGQNVGFGGEVVVDSLSSYNTLIVDQINKNYSTLLTDISIPLNYVNKSGITTSIGSSVVLSGTSAVNYDQVFDGLHMKVTALNHANHSSNNIVNISEVIPDDDVPFTTLNEELSQTENTIMNVADTTGFDVFEGLKVASPGNIGYVLIDDEVIGFTTFTSNTIGGLTRGVDGTQIQIHTQSSEVRKYEFGGISLRRINIDHSLSSVDRENHPTTLNSFYIKIDPSTNGPSRSGTLYFDETRQVGVSGITVTNNIQFETLRPNFSVINPASTSLSAKIRTTSATSISGNEESFNDEGFTDISLSDLVSFDTPRMVASVVNEKNRITGTPGNKSLTMEFLMSTEDSLVSPVLDIERASVILTSNLINAPSGLRNSNDTYADDEFVRSAVADKHEAIYVSNTIKLKIPGNSLKVIMDSNINTNSDIRVLYQLIRVDSPGPINWEPFPGFSNLSENSDGISRVIDSSKNNGSEDEEVKRNDSDEFTEYEYTVDNLPEFNEFRIKVVLASKNQAKPPLVRSLKGIATAKPNLSN